MLREFLEPAEKREKPLTAKDAKRLSASSVYQIANTEWRVQRIRCAKASAFGPNRIRQMSHKANDDSRKQVSDDSSFVMCSCGANNGSGAYGAGHCHHFGARSQGAPAVAGVRTLRGRGSVG